MDAIQLDRIYNEDCLEGMKRIPDGTIDLVVTDCPYKICSGGCTKAVPEYDECGGILTHRKTEKRTDWVDDVRTGKMFQDNEIAFDEWLPVIYAKLKEQAHCYIMVNSRNLKELQQKAEAAREAANTAAKSAFANEMKRADEERVETPLSKLGTEVAYEGKGNVRVDIPLKYELTSPYLSQ